MLHFKDGKNKSSALTTRWAQMSKQEQIIERKKMEIQAKLEAQKQAAALAAQAKLINSSIKEESDSPNIFSNDGSFMNQYKKLLEQKKEKEEKEEIERQKALEDEKKNVLIQLETQATGSNETHSNDRKARDRQNRWSDKGRNNTHSPPMPVLEERQKLSDQKNIPPLMQIPIMPPEPTSPLPFNKELWKPDESGPHSDSVDQSGNLDSNLLPFGPMGGPPMGPMGGPPMGPMGPGHGPMGPGPGLMGSGPGPMCSGPSGAVGSGPGGRMGSGLSSMGSGPGSMGSGPLSICPSPMGSGPGPMSSGSGPLGPGPGMGPGLGSMRPNAGPMGPGPMRPWGPGGNGPMNNSSNMGPGPMMGPGGRMPPFMGGPNFPMPPNFMGPNGPNGPRGPCGPGPMPPNMCGPNMRGPGPNGPMPPFYPPFANPQMMRPNGGPNQMMPPNCNDNANSSNRPFMGPRPPFPPNFGANGPPPPFMPPGIHPNSIPNPLQNSDPKQELGSIPTVDKSQNVPSPVPHLNRIPPLKDIGPGNMPPNMSQVFSADRMPPVVQRAAVEVASNGDQWENVLKAIHSQDQNMWFLHNPNSNEYKSFRDLVIKIRAEGSKPVKPEVKPEDKYEPEFSLEDDDSNDGKPIKQETNSHIYDWKANNPYMSNVKAEQTSSQSDEDSDVRKERRKRKKSRWGNDPPVTDIKPPGVMIAMPTGLPGAKLSKLDEDGLKFTSLNQNNPALMQYAMTNYGTTNLNIDDWKKCEDNFKLNLLYQDMLKKRQEVERMNAVGKNKYEYDSDEDTSTGTWEHRLRAKEMFATEKWANELTKQAAGKHHIGDFLPPEELRKFMEQYSAARGGKEPDLSDYKEYKLKEDNIGFKMLQKLGWNEGQGLGAEGTGIIEPINKANQPLSNLGLGAAQSEHVSPNDDEFDAYRKRMMLAYRFRPNPLNNPRRPYY
ncbi:arginine-glutamic acid dipeptide repeats protein-like isoform X1 [Pieris brassicae]|uniref:arginine-glutamic acid dipeptide repeats protein-like isoform X1 n=2 Tax=Pieris brassicae TaxID=7116 RepID=UPI001E65F06E|nr:arginine-glutamic acid dipeptide repeats protein-like isoform X1 [Pieris brassicae]